MKFRVNLGWHDDYMFDSADEAMRFAITAKVKREDKSNYVRVDLLSEADIEELKQKEDCDDD